ncbi:MAG: DUF2157 domain-containing protein [Dehalococcoidia bacterium]|jgi:uncharacterized membrane protein|nr:DUF2157 domain-containing protein [Dehalococcoidia bacterium]
MSQLPGNDPFIDRLPAELQDWQDRGIITAEQASDIVASYDLPPDLAQGQKSRGKLITILVVFGSLLVGLGIILFIAANWDAIPRAVRLALILAGIPGVYATGYWLGYVRNFQRVGMAVLLLAAVLYGAGIHLVAQVYNSPVDDPKLVTLWFLGVLPLAYVSRSQVIVVLSQGLFLLAIGYWVFEWIDGPDEGLAIFGFALYMTLGALLYGLGKLQSRFDFTRDYAGSYEIVGIIVMMGAVFLLSFRELHDPDFDWEFGVDLEVTTNLKVLFFLAGAGTVASMAGAAVIRMKNDLPLSTLIYEAGAIALSLVIAYLVVFAHSGNNALYPILFNLLLFAGIIGLVFAGYSWRREAFINLALIFFGLDVFARYFEFSWGLLDRSLVFIVAGLVLLGGGYLLERGRSSMVDRMETQGDES